SYNINYYMKVRNYLPILIASFILIFTSCNRESTLGSILSKETKNSIYKDIEEEKLAAILQSTLEQEGRNLKNKTFITNYYYQNDYRATLIKKFIPDNKLGLLAERLA